jgi:hypothetical protein
MIITTKVEVHAQRIADLLVGLFENGASEWLGSVDRPDGAAAGHEWYSSGKFLSQPGWHFFANYDVPDGEEGEFVGRKIVRLVDLEEAIQTMANDYPAHFADILNESDDANTADIFGQLVILGEVVYG